MWKRLNILIFFVQLASSIASADERAVHLQKIKAKHPHALLGEDFGILTEDDLGINQCTADPVPFSRESYDYPYWQCFELKNSAFICDDTGYDQSEKSRLAIMAISFPSSPRKDEYLSRRAIPRAGCENHRKDWLRLTQGETHVCLLGPLISYEKTDYRKNMTSWIFDAFKTRKGCHSYFEGGCDIKYKIKHGCILD